MKRATWTKLAEAPRGELESLMRHGGGSAAATLYRDREGQLYKYTVLVNATGVSAYWEVAEAFNEEES